MVHPAEVESACPMNPRIKFLLLIFGLTLPYLAFALHFMMQYPSNHQPEWLVNTLAIWFCSNFVIAMIASKHIFRGTKTPAAPPAPLPPEKRLPVQIAMWFSTYLVIVWTGLFIYGIFEVVSGEAELRRALLAGGMLLFFIVIFGRSILKMRRVLRAGAKSQTPT